MKADLHMHTTCSDGTFTPYELVAHAKERNVDIIAVTDHDTVEGIEDALKAGSKLGIKVIPGIELSTDFNRENIHVLGYFTGDGYKDPQLISFLDDLKLKREERARKILSNLKELYNIDISFEDLTKHADGVIARPHIAREILKHRPKYSWDKVFKKYLSDGAPAYIPSVKLPTEAGINLLKKHGAVVSLAHPTIIKKTKVAEFALFDIDGMECIYPENKLGETSKFRNICEKNNLIVTGGSDFHGALEQDTMHHDIGTVCLEEKDLERFLAKLYSANKGL